MPEHPLAGVESTDAPPDVERTREFIEQPSYFRDGRPTHRPDAVVAHPADAPAPVLAESGPPVPPAPVVEAPPETASP